MSWVAVAVAGGTVLSAAISSKSASKAADTQSKASDAATKYQYDTYLQNRADTAPWRQVGEYAINRLIQPNLGSDFGILTRGPGEFKESPSYQFTLGEGMKGIQRAASATGRLGSGAYLKDATKYAEGLASTEYDNFLNRYYKSLDPWMSLAGMGQTSVGQLGQSSTSTANALSQIALQKGQAQAAGNLGAAYPWSQAIGYGTNQLSQYLTNRNMQNQVGLTNYWAGNEYTPQQMNTMTWL